MISRKRGKKWWEGGENGFLLGEKTAWLSVDQNPYKSAPIGPLDLSRPPLFRGFLSCFCSCFPAIRIYIYIYIEIGRRWTEKRENVGRNWSSKSNLVVGKNG